MLVCCDIDGVICDPLEYVQKYLIDTKDWKTYLSYTSTFKPIYTNIYLIQCLRLDGHDVVFVTGRPEHNRELTVRWLSEHVGTFYNHQLLMRKDEEQRPTHNVKLEWYKNLMPDLIIDDDPEVVLGARVAGFLVLQVHGYRIEGSKDQIPENFR